VESHTRLVVSVLLLSIQDVGNDRSEAGYCSDISSSAACTDAKKDTKRHYSKERRKVS
jgi:hypothetical protein